MDVSQGLDLLLHTPGGSIAATESIVNYLKSKFGNDVRAIVPQLAMSAGTMMCFSAKSIVMGKHSDLGPIDPHLKGVSCQSVLDEFNKAKRDIQTNPANEALWKPIIAKYHPTFIGQCENAIKWSKELALDWLSMNMLSESTKEAINLIVSQFSDPSEQYSHNRHIPVSECEAKGLVIERLEKDQQLQNAVLNTHHACMHTIIKTRSNKMIENQLGASFFVNSGA